MHCEYLLRRWLDWEHMHLVRQIISYGRIRCIVYICSHCYWIVINWFIVIKSANLVPSCPCWWLVSVCCQCGWILTQSSNWLNSCLCWCVMSIYSHDDWIEFEYANWVHTFHFRYTVSELISVVPLLLACECLMPLCLDFKPVVEMIEFLS